jgi:indolepyruvate ferredoxin oxidoreductase
MPKTPQRQLDELRPLAIATLTAYQNAALAQRWQAGVEHCRARAQAVGMGMDCVLLYAQVYLRVLWVKDEYEVARLHTDKDFAGSLQDQFEGDFRVVYHFAPPVWAAQDGHGRPRKSPYAGWRAALLPALARLKFLRRTPMDVFAWSAERREEFGWIDFFEQVWRACDVLFDRQDTQQIRRILEIFQSVKGFGQIRARTQAAARSELSLLLHRINLRHDKDSGT